MSKVIDSLSKLFEKHRIVIWYDGDQKFIDQFNELDIPGILKITIDRNEFALKYQMLIQQPSGKFLLFAPFNKPENEDNWLLDIELSNHVFHTDQEAMYLQELNLQPNLRNWVSRYIDFFNSKERLGKLKGNIEAGDTEDQLTGKLVQIVLGATTHQLDDLLKTYAAAIVNEKVETIDKELKRFNLFEPFWENVEAIYSYRSSNQGIYDFLIEVFQKNYTPTSKNVGLNRSAEVLLSSWKDTKSFEGTYKQLAEKIEQDLEISSKLENESLESLISEDVFIGIDKKIIQEIANIIDSETISPEKVDQILKQRETTYWFNVYKPFYNALSYANWILTEIKSNRNIKIEDYQDGFKKYTEHWFLIDQYYRLFIENFRETKQNSVLNSLYQKIHKAYSNTWLMELSDKWQTVIEKSSSWYFGAQSQQQFFKRDIKPRYIDKNIKVFVVISDALRYECAETLHQLFSEEIRFTSTLEYQITGLPSYTQLGMASLLPHEELSFGEGDSILIDGKSTIGAGPRKKILEENSKVRATTINAEDLMRFTSKGTEAQELIQNHELIYVYHNRIDKIGDDKTSEDKVIEASKEEIEFLVDVAKKITSMNGYHVVFTADHGFVYQHEALNESDFTDAKISGDLIKDSRRYVLGKNLSHNNNVVKYNAKDLRINSDVEVLIPKGINRLRKQGSGSRYVHGGATLQEVVVPVLFVSKKKTNTVSKVDVDILNKTNNRITTNIHGVKFYQQQPIGEGIVSRTIKSYFVELNGDQRSVISDFFNYTFDSESNRAEDRETQYSFKISTTSKRSQNIQLIIEEKVEGTSKWNLVGQFPYTLSLTMGNDFDDF
jgi:uncharacterized protein (TIGR02687 family)